MEYFDEEILKAKREIEYLRHDSLETGIYVEDELITFSEITLPETKISIYLPEQFIDMPDMVKDIKYPSKNAPDYVYTSLDSMVNFNFNVLDAVMEDGDIQEMGSQFRNALCNVNPSIRIKSQTDDEKTVDGNEMSWFDFKSFALDGQIYNRMYVIRMRSMVLHGIFNCPMRVKEQWADIAGKCFMTVKETI